MNDKYDIHIKLMLGCLKLDTQQIFETCIYFINTVSTIGVIVTNAFYINLTLNINYVFFQLLGIFAQLQNHTYERSHKEQTG